ncbi:MAG: SHOCT domain-containing protein [Acidimicrobiia bacterium]
METFFDFFWFMLWFFLWVIWVWMLIRIFGDIFRSEISGAAKALWVLFVLVLPFLGVLVYLIANGDGMAKREVASVQAAQHAQQEYIRSVAGGGVAEELEKLAGLRDRGVISASEFETQKAKLLA